METANHLESGQRGQSSLHGDARRGGAPAALRLGDAADDVRRRAVEHRVARTGNRPTSTFSSLDRT